MCVCWSTDCLCWPQPSVLAPELGSFAPRKTGSVSLAAVVFSWTNLAAPYCDTYRHMTHVACVSSPTCLMCFCLARVLTQKLKASYMLVHMPSSCRFGSLEAILAPGADLKPYGAAHKLLGEGQPGTDARRAAAAANLAVLRMRPQQQRLPQQQLQQCYSQALQQLRGQQPALQPSPPQPSQQQCGGLPPHHVQTQQVEAHESPQRNVGSHVSWLHPARRLHIQQCQPFLAVLQEALHSLGFTRQQANWTSPTTGLWCDLLAQPTSALAADGDSNSSSDASGVRLAFQILGPADLAAGAWVVGCGCFKALSQQLAPSVVECWPCAWTKDATVHAGLPAP